MEITPAFLDQTIRQVRDLGFEIIHLDEMYQRLKTGQPFKRFVCFTLDDGYVDNYLHAAPVFKAHEAPFAIYATTGFLDHTALFWWMLLEEVLRKETSVVLKVEGREEHRRTVTVEQKVEAFTDLHHLFRLLPANACLKAAKQLADDYGIDPSKLCADHSMTWDMAREITRGELGSIEAHTVTHLALSRQEPEDIDSEMARCCARIKEETGRAPKHFAYPFGDAGAVGRREVDLVGSRPILTATTTRGGMISPGDAAQLAALPRITINGYYQSAEYIEIVLSGIHNVISRSMKRLRIVRGRL